MKTQQTFCVGFCCGASVVLVVVAVFVNWRDIPLWIEPESTRLLGRWNLLHDDGKTTVATWEFFKDGSLTEVRPTKERELVSQGRYHIEDAGFLRLEFPSTGIASCPIFRTRAKSVQWHCFEETGRSFYDRDRAHLELERTDSRPTKPLRA